MFPNDLLKSEQHDPTQSKLSVYPWRFYGDNKTLKCRFQTSFYSEYPWIEYSIKIRGLNIQLKRMRLLVSAVSFLSWGKGNSPFFSCVKRLKKLSTKHNGP